jgi:3D (Asp-Asp-Asp) domain-containing protein
VVRIAQKTIYHKEDIPVTIERTTDNTLESGIQRTVQQGTPGIERQTIMVSYEDGKEVSREVINSEIIKPPKKKIVAMGVLTSISRGGNRIDFQRAIEMRASAYSYSAGSITSTGQKVRVGGIAVDPSVISYGSRVYVEGYGYATAIDCGGAIKGNRIDVFFETDKECRKWGVKKVKIYIL